MAPIDEIESAFSYDKSLSAAPLFKKKLTQKYLPPQKYSLKKLHESMYGGNIMLFSNYPVKEVVKNRALKAEKIMGMLKKGLPRKEKIYIRTGSSRTLKRVTIEHTLDRWLRQKSKFGVTDLHIRGTGFYKDVDADAISYFNLLPKCKSDVSILEMLTMIISSRGIFSDSHSDDGDGCNHCFVGKKLWLAWDRTEGKKMGLEDVSFDDVYTQARFSLKKFVAMKSSRWFLVTENQTLFMPGNFVHKVITLEPYIGFSNFYLAPPNYINCLIRWCLMDATYAKGAFLTSLNKQCMPRLRKIAASGKTEIQKYGTGYFYKALKHWRSGLTPAQAALLNNHPVFSAFCSYFS